MIVFLDVDGVLANWNAGVFEKLGMHYAYDKWPFAKGRDGWDWNKEIGKDFTEISDLCDFDLWANLQWMPDGKEIYGVVRDIFGEANIRLLTAPMPNVESASGKMEWVYRNLPQLKRQVIITTAPKDVLAQVPDSILIDDSSANVDAWRAAGGKAVLVSRWWNDNYEYAMNTVGVLERDLE